MSIFDAQKIVCGYTWPDPVDEAAIQTSRREQGFRTDGGCGKEMPWTVSYRCLECGRFMHSTCLKRHFEETGDDKKVAS